MTHRPTISEIRDLRRIAAARAAWAHCTGAIELWRQLKIVVQTCDSLLHQGDTFDLDCLLARAEEPGDKS